MQNNAEDLGRGRRGWASGARCDWILAVRVQVRPGGVW